MSTKRLYGDDDFDAGPVSVMRPQGFCTVRGCGKESFIAFADVCDPSGKRCFVIPGDAIDVSYPPNSRPQWKLRPGYTVYGYVERCGACYSRERIVESGEPVGWEQEPFCHVRNVQDFCAFFGVKSVGEALAGVVGTS
jgi:hypothetical protein